MLRRYLVTGFAGQHHMVGDGLGSRDLCMAGRAGPWDLGWGGVVGIVTADTRLHRIVQPLDDLGETGGS